ncbi:MAG: sugar phosphate isomerase/epimerase family protein [Bacteroidia bacterium]
MICLASVEKINEEVLAWLHSEGIGVELSYFSLPWHLDSADLKADIQRHKQLLNHFPLAKSMHGAFYDLNFTSRDSLIRAVSTKRVYQSLEIAEELEMKHIVFHTAYVESRKNGYKNYWIEKQVAFWETILPQIEKTGITIYLENTREPDASYIAAIVKSLNHDLCKICYDTGHSECFTDTKLPPAQWAKEYGSDLRYVHLHSNHGWTDDHIAFHQGIISFEGFFEILEQINPMLIIEVKTKADLLASIEELRRCKIL